MADALKRTSTSGTETVIKGDGDYSDDEGLIEQYKAKGKVRQYEKIKTNAHNIQDDQRECHLWEDVSWKRTIANTEAENTEVVPTVEQESCIKAKQQVKVEKEDGAAGYPKDPAEPTTLGSSQLAKPENAKGILDKIIAKVEELHAETSEPVAKFLLSYVVPKNNAANAKADAVSGEISMILENKIAAWKAISLKFSQAKSELEAARNSLAMQLDEAKKQME